MHTQEHYRDLKLYNKIRHYYEVSEKLPSEMARLLRQLERRERQDEAPRQQN
ncbi:hypothetical protein [Prosthecomicrobium sp. N25]|uniref:hypothetical protein n=1 Tax=Prosthecomicrobium sp. N25 TaxID=3129254 RepID=UPI0030778141